MTKKTSPNRICENRRAFFDYELLDKYEAGLELKGWEVKSLRQSRGEIVGAYIKWMKGELFLVGSRIDPLQNTGNQAAADSGAFESDRIRKLLLHSKEIKKIHGAMKVKGLNCIPLNLHWRGSHIKCEIATARGKKTKDKRETIKKRDLERSEERSIKF